MRMDDQDGQRVEAPVPSGASAFLDEASRMHPRYAFAFWDVFEDWIETTDSPWVRED